KIQILNKYGYRCNYKHMKSILEKLYHYHYEGNRVFDEILREELPSYILADSKELFSHGELMDYIKPIIERNEKKITLNDILEKQIEKHITLDDYKKFINQYDSIIKQKLIAKEKFDLFILNNSDSGEKLKYFLSQYQSILFSKSHIDYGLPFYLSYFNKMFQQRKDIFIDYPILTLNLIRHPKIKKTIMENFTDQ